MKSMASSTKKSENSTFSYSALSKEEKSLIEKAKEFLTPITEKYNLDLATLFQSIPDSIPVSIFISQLTILESIVKYLKEEKNLSLSTIAEFLNRDERNIWHIYNNAKRKYPQKFVIKTGKIVIPLSVFSGTKLSALETIVTYLKENSSLTYHEIAVLINRDERTVWTVYQRARKKNVK